MKNKLASIAAGLALAILAGCSASQQDPHPVNTPSSSPSPSVRPEATSRYIGFSVPGFPPDPDRLVRLETATGVQVSAVSFYMGIGKKLDIMTVSSLCSSGILPVVEIDSDKIPLSDIAAGAEDAVLRAYARQIASVHGAVAIDFDHEFNGPWFELGIHPRIRRNVRRSLAAHRHRLPPQRCDQCRVDLEPKRRWRLTRVRYALGIQAMPGSRWWVLTVTSTPRGHLQNGVRPDT